VTSAWTSATCPRGALSIAAGFGCSACVTLTASGDTDLYTWGSNDYGVLGQGSKEPEIVPQPTQVHQERVIGTWVLVDRVFRVRCLSFVCCVRDD
jgi:alpha-tubulin suppressor-like RCC1 family protein